MEVKPLVQTLDENENKEDDQVNEDNVVTGLIFAAQCKYVR